MKPRTSESHPMRIATLAFREGALGVTFCPGKQGASVHGAPWARDLEQDLDVIRQWGAAAVLTLVEDHELRSLGVANLGERVRARGMLWHHLPIVDLQPPGAPFEAAWPEVAPALHRLAAGGGRVLVHCRGGLGRAGTVAARLLVEAGVGASEAIERVRRARPGAIETREQERHVLRCGEAGCPPPAS